MQALTCEIVRRMQYGAVTVGLQTGKKFVVQFLPQHLPHVTSAGTGARGGGNVKNEGGGEEEQLPTEAGL